MQNKIMGLWIYDFFEVGKVIIILVPQLTLLETCMDPLCSEIIHFTIDNPNLIKAAKKAKELNVSLEKIEPGEGASLSVEILIAYQEMRDIDNDFRLALEFRKTNPPKIRIKGIKKIVSPIKNLVPDIK